MNQFQFDLICKLIQNGAPALSNELIGALSNIVNEANALREANAALRMELQRRDAECEEPCAGDGKCSSCEEKACEAVEG